MKSSYETRSGRASGNCELSTSTYVAKTSTHVAMSVIWHFVRLRISQEDSGKTTTWLLEFEWVLDAALSCSGSRSARSMYSQARIASISFLWRVGILLITYAGSWEVGWGGLQVAEVREAVEEGVVVVGARYGRGMRGRGRGRLNTGALPAALKVGR